MIATLEKRPPVDSGVLESDDIEVGPNQPVSSPSAVMGVCSHCGTTRYRHKASCTRLVGVPPAMDSDDDVLFRKLPKVSQNDESAPTVCVGTQSAQPGRLNPGYEPEAIRDTRGADVSFSLPHARRTAISDCTAGGPSVLGEVARIRRYRCIRCIELSALVIDGCLCCAEFANTWELQV